MKDRTPIFGSGWRSVITIAVYLSVSCVWGTAWAQMKDGNINVDQPCNNPDITYAATPGQVLPTDVRIEVIGSSDNEVYWDFTNSSPASDLACAGGPLVWTCAGMTVKLPTPANPSDHKVPTSEQVKIDGTASQSQEADAFTLKVTDANNDPAESCSRTYTLHVTATGGGWGDPHITTVDGVHYDFQSAGEFTALRQDGLEIQTRQGAVPTATVPITNPYTDITHCVAIYTAVAARLGSSRVTLQPRAGGGDANMQLRVNGKVVMLTDTPLVVTSGNGDNVGGAAAANGKIDATITRLANGVIDITDARGTQIVVTPQYWSSQKVWYLNVNVYQTSAHEGTMGSIAEGSWLPALPDGSSLGPKPESEDERYEQLYEKFADAWRVTDANSLFDYEPGTSTATFTLDEWPRNRPQSCGIAGQTSAQPATEQAAQQACAGVNDAIQKADCVFDVMITGHTGFAKSYEIMQEVKPRGPGWYSPTPASTDRPTEPPKPWWMKWWWILLALLVLLVLLIIRFLMKRSSAP